MFTFEIEFINQDGCVDYTQLDACSWYELRELLTDMEHELGIQEIINVECL